jgi:prepilin-type N-terminal cleavage/methylation domain-containing protein
MKLERKNNEGRRNREQAGFTLAEVMVAVAIVGIAFASLYVGMGSGLLITQSSRENLRATQIMLERMEGIRLHNWNQITISNMVPTKFATRYYPKTLGGNTNSQGIMYSGAINISTPVISPAPTYVDKLRMVDVEIQWKSGEIQRSRSMSTLVAQDGLQNYVFSN